ncbi:MAG: M3 family metallopeptidase [bacterium]|nr:M3 family metallopeptidase [bacterium]
MAVDETRDNPLLDQSGLPRFDAIAVEHVEPGMRALLRQAEADFEALENSLEPTWSGLVEPIERIGDRLGFSWGIVGHLMGVRNSDELRAAHKAMQPEVIALSVRMGQSRRIYDGLLALRDGPVFAQLDAAQQRIVEVSIRDAELSGVGLDGSERDAFNEIQQELAELATRFDNHVMDATREFALVLRDKDEVAGLPESWLQFAAQLALEAGEEGANADEGPWRVTLDYPSLLPFLQHSRRRDLRETLYRSNITRASSGNLDNGPVIERILELRLEEAKLLGFSSFAEVSLVPKMATNVAAVRQLLEELRAASHEAAHREHAELAEFAASRSAPEASDLRQWDISFWAERQREELYAYSEDELRPYFPLPRVLDGLFALARRLFGVTIQPADGGVPVWHEDVRFFRVLTDGGDPIAAFYLDPYSRPSEKRGGAWMDECVGRSSVAQESGVRLPVAYLVCNQTPPVGDKPSLMTFNEVETLFHEFGHGLQHVLTRVDYGLASGIRNVEWDAVELASQFMENWCYHRETLLGIAKHFDTEEVLPEDLFQKICASRTFRAGSAMLRQIFFSSTDLELHDCYVPGGTETYLDVERRVARATMVLEPLPEDRFLCSFSHIFAGGYAAGYFSYKWAEVLSADAFSAFEEAGLQDDAAIAEIGARYRETVLALGGSRRAMEVFIEFRGREPKTEALLRHSGLAIQCSSAAC